MKRALVQSGGGSLGAYSAGVVQALTEAGKRWSIFAGISAGALNSAFLSMFAQDDAKAAIQRLVYIWLSLESRDIWKRHFPFGKLHALWGPSVYSTDPMREFIKKYFNLRKARDSGNELYVSATSISTGQGRVFDLDYDGLDQALLASSAYPMLFEPILLDGELYVDGGIQHAAPIQAAIDAGAEEIDLVLTEPEEGLTLLPEPVCNVFQVAARVFPITLHSIFERDLQLALKENEQPVPGQGNQPGVAISVYRPKRRLAAPFNMIDLDPKVTNEWINQGYEDTKEGLSP